VRVEVRLFATLERYLPPGSHAGVAVLDVPQGSTAADVARQLGIPIGLERVLLINGRDATPDRLLAAGDVLDLYPPLAGGSAGLTEAHPTPPVESAS
jgi:molybdopterin converting factor small subunit